MSDNGDKSESVSSSGGVERHHYVIGTGPRNGITVEETDDEPKPEPINCDFVPDFLKDKSEPISCEPIPEPKPIICDYVPDFLRDPKPVPMAGALPPSYVKSATFENITGDE